MADQWGEPLSGSVTARILPQQPIPVFDQFAFICALLLHSIDPQSVRALPRRWSAHCRGDDPCIAARASAYCRTATSEKSTQRVCRKGMFSVSHTVRTFGGQTIYVHKLTKSSYPDSKWYHGQILVSNELRIHIQFCGDSFWKNWTVTGFQIALNWDNTFGWPWFPVRYLMHGNAHFWLTHRIFTLSSLSNSTAAKVRKQSMSRTFRSVDLSQLV